MPVMVANPWWVGILSAIGASVLTVLGTLLIEGVRAELAFKRQLAQERVEAYKILLMHLANMNRLWLDLRKKFVLFFDFKSDDPGCFLARNTILKEINQIFQDDYLLRNEKLDWAKGFIRDSYNWKIIETVESTNQTMAIIQSFPDIYSLNKDSSEAIQLFEALDKAGEDSLSLYREIRQFIHHELYPNE